MPETTVHIDLPRIDAVSVLRVLGRAERDARTPEEAAAHRATADAVRAALRATDELFPPAP